MILTIPGDRVCVRPEALPEQTASGLWMPHDRSQSVMLGEVVAVGDGPVSPRGVRLPHQVSVGDRVLFSPDTGAEIIFDKETLLIMAEVDVLAIVN